VTLLVDAPPEHREAVLKAAVADARRVTTTVSRRED
jgi:hypothetical protein